MRIENQTFVDTTITLDYNQFVGCTIRDCLVVCHGGDFLLERTTLQNCRFVLSGPANNALQFLRLVRANGEHLLNELLDQGPQYRPDQVKFN
ncbi:MAG: hypothetical protein ACHQD6_08990 [Steroidobacterales bacterium]|jgi:hypothetical protein